MKTNKKVNKKFKQIIILSVILILIGTSGLFLATLYGGSSENKYGGNFSATGSGLSGETITSFTEASISQIVFSITNNANSPYSTTETATIKKKPITVSSTTDLTAYQKMVTIPYTIGMGTDFEHIEIKDASGTILPMWIEDYTSSTSADVWVKGDFSTGDTIIYVHYGDDVTTVNDPDNVFLEFDNFDDFSEWTIATDKNALVSSIEYVLSGKYTAKRTGMQVFDRSDCNYDNAIYEIKMYQTVSSGLDGVFRKNYDSSTLLMIGGEYGFSTVNYYYRHISDKYNAGISQSIGWHDYKFILDGTNINGYIDGTKVTSNIAYTSADGDISIGDYWVDYGGTIYYDNFKVRKYTASEPTYVIGSEETVFDGTITLAKQKVLTIDNTGGSTITDYDLPFTVTYDSDMQGDMDDLWFTETDGTHIPHFKGVYTDSTSAKVYISLNCDADSTKQVYMYYGNPYTADLSDPENMFTIFEGFDGAVDTNDWYVNVGTDDTFTIKDSTGTLILNDISEQTTFLDSKSLFSSPVIIESYYKPNFYGTTGGTTATRCSLVFHTTSQVYWENDGFGAYVAWRGVSPNDWTNSLSPDGTNTNVVYNRQWIDTKVIYNSGDMKYYINDVLTSTNTKTITNGYVGIHRHIGAIDAIGYQDVTFDYLIVRPYIDNEPSVSFGTELSLSNPTITASCIGDSNEQVYGAEMKDFSLIPTSDISQFIIDGSPNYDFDATLYYSGDTNVVENATNGTMNITFTPSILIEEGYANGVFTGNLTFENYTITATLDDVEFTNVTLTNETISAKLINCDTTEHVISISITENSTETETPTIPSSGGGGGGSVTTPIVEDIEENTTESIPQISEQLDKEEVQDLISNNFQTTMILVLFVAFVFLAFAIYKKK